MKLFPKSKNENLKFPQTKQILINSILKTQMNLTFAEFSSVL